MDRPSIWIYVLIAGVLGIVPTAGLAQYEAGVQSYEMSLRLLDNDPITEVATGFDIKRFTGEIEAAISSIEREIGIFEPKDQAFAVRFTLFPDRDYDIEVFGRPELDVEATKSFSVPSRVSDYPVAR